MSFNYNPAIPDDVTRVRFHIGDRAEAVAWYQDEEIDFAIDEEGGWKPAVISLLTGMIVEIGREPQMRADWLQINWAGSVEALQAALAEKRARFGIAARSGSAKATYRSDSLQTEAPEW